VNYRQLGRYGIRLSEVGLGGWLTQGRTLSDDATTQIVHRAFELGINFFDTADVYHSGASERSLGKAVKSLKREDLVIATKCYFPMSDGVNDRNLSRKHITESLHASLKRLGQDYVDLYQFHRFDPTTPLDETVRAIDDLIRQGKALYWGVSEWPAERIAELVAVAKELNAHPPVSNQPLYNMLARGIEPHIMPTCQRNGMGLVVFSPLAQGILTGKYAPGKPPPKGSRGADDKSNMFMKDLLSDATLTKVDQVRRLAAEHGFELPRFALAWCLRHSAVTSVIIGATSVEQLEMNARASGAAVDDALWAQAEELLA